MDDKHIKILMHTAATLVSIAAATLIVLRLFYPTLKIDEITIGLFVIVLLPWLATVVKKLKLPGGVEIEFPNLQAASRSVQSALPPAAHRGPRPSPHIVVTDPNLALVWLRIEIEKRVRQIADAQEIAIDQPLASLLSELKRENVFDERACSGLQEIIWAGNEAARGASVEPSVADWAFSDGIDLLESLDAFIANRGI